MLTDLNVRASSARVTLIKPRTKHLRYMTQRTRTEYQVTFENVSILKLTFLTTERHNRLCPFSTEGSNTVQHVNVPEDNTTYTELLQVHWSTHYADFIQAQ
jgi:hypothetical protein